LGGCNIQHDVVVVGAGPAGSTAAKFLSEKGIKVLLIDKSKFPRSKPCGGGLPSRVLNRFNYLEELGAIESYTFGGVAYSTSLENHVNVVRDKPVGAMILREKFDHGLVKHAVDCGATFLEDKSVMDVKKSKDKVTIFLQDGTKIESKIVVGCDGVWSVVAKKSGMLGSRKNIGMCIFEEYPMNVNVLDKYFSEKRICHIHLKPQDLAGYGWVFPKKNHVNIGIGQIQSTTQTDNKINLKKVFEDYIILLKEAKIIPNNLISNKVKGGAIPIYPLEKTYSDRILLCGDAAGFINPISGEGIYYAMASGEIAAGVISESLDANNFNEEFLSRYQKLWVKDFGRDLKLLLQSNKQWTKGPKQIVRLASMDQKLANLAFSVLQGEISIYEFRWKLISRYLYVYLKSKIKKKSNANE